MATVHGRKGGALYGVPRPPADAVARAGATFSRPPADGPRVRESGLDPAPDCCLRFPRPEPALDRRTEQLGFDRPPLEHAVDDELTEAERRPVQSLVAA